MRPPAALPARLLVVVAPVWVAGAAIVVAAAYAFATAEHEATALAGALILLGAAMLAERFPVPLDDVDAGGVSLGFVFGVAAIVLFGWGAGVLILFLSSGLVHLLEHRPPVRVAYNAGVFALGAGAAGAAIAPIDGTGPGALLAAVTIAFATQFTVNWLLVTAAVAAHSRRPLGPLLRANLGSMGVPVALMGSAALMLVVLWQRSPFFSAALIGPLLAIALYQRSTYRAIRAMRLALTDPLTGLGNHRHFQERLQRELLDAQARDTPLSLCLVDLDDFKAINDRFGHPVGDRVLAQAAARLRQRGEAFRLGGDEFAVLLPGHDGAAASAAATSIVERLSATMLERDVRVTGSAGVATYPEQGVGRDELIRFADSALYWAKEHGKNQMRAYRPDVVEPAELKRLAAGPDRAAGFPVAAS